jgi:diguanylate cyclase (GGDEF)-like protein
LKLDVSIPRSSVNRARKLLRPSGTAAFCAAILFTFLAGMLDDGANGPAYRIARVAFPAAGLVIAWLGCGRQNKSARPVMQGFLVLALLTPFAQYWWRIPYLEPSAFQILLAGVASLMFGLRDALILVGVMTLLSFVNPRPGAPAEFLAGTAFDMLLFSGSALLIAHLTSGQRRKIAALREELYLIRSNPLTQPEETAAEAVPEGTRRPSGGEGELESFDASIHAILVRIREYFRAHSVLLYQLQGSRSLALRHWVSDVAIDTTPIRNPEESLLGRIFGRGLSCNWNLDDPNCSVGLKDIPYYQEWQPIRNLAGSPLRLRNQAVGILVVDRTAPAPFTELELVHIETFAIQLVEMIEMGKRYLEQVDRNMEYRLFYRAMSELGQSLATEEILAALANACQEVVSSTHLLISLLDETGLSYEIGYALGVEKLKGAKVKSQGRTWISWQLNSDTGPLLLKDIHSHASKMPVASPKEGDLPIRSVIMLPLVAKSKKMGIVFLGSTQPDYYRNWHLRILAAICQQAAANIENSLLHRRVENEAFSDGLTHLFNHRYFQERLKTEISRARRNKSRLSLLMADIDHFKKVNDNYGHRIGDLILQQMGDVLKRTIRTEDAVARYGGEEFVIILAGSNKKGALKMAERVRAAAESISFYAEEHRLSVSISLGAATYPDDALEPWELIECADRALYAAKRQGRNRVVAYDSVEDRPARIRDLRS